MTEQHYAIKQSQLAVVVRTAMWVGSAIGFVVGLLIGALYL